MMILCKQNKLKRNNAVLKLFLLWLQMHIEVHFPAALRGGHFLADSDSDSVCEIRQKDLTFITMTQTFST